MMGLQIAADRILNDGYHALALLKRQQLQSMVITIIKGQSDSTHRRFCTAA
jgi:hypothetical protein